MDKFAAVMFILGLAIFTSFLLAWPVMLLWNGCLVDAVEGVKGVTWLQAWGINLLAGIMFGTNTKFKPK